MQESNRFSGKLSKEQVMQNLTDYNAWSSVEEHEACIQGKQTVILTGIPPKKLVGSDQENQLEWVVPLDIARGKLDVGEINCWFSEIERISGHRPGRITLGTQNDDSTIVYYFVHDGIVKPQRN
ncbi:Piso0_001636 [Millerozyma farinosa CBS 7064]|uniref:Piso0_001636 protein n=1 Tax=Pichia sorbitophila (strain ATCC MYA-4447 / BCRC 22081 / CBS 7064 / NBRC 10061 / NRRL Y-12695) TaxID=559304 RepID=G8YNP4_PICSO|nr:Piso0_001636 [Millerozyma farinosa CBS 7064]